MKYDPPLLRGKLVSRYKRFFADIVLDSGEAITAHTPNTGTMLTCKDPGSVAYVSRADNPKRKLKYTWELVASGKTLVGVHTGRANGLAEEGIRNGVVAELQGYARLRREVRYGNNSRVDILLDNGLPRHGLPRHGLPHDGVPDSNPLDNGPPDGGPLPPCYVEVKNVTLARDGLALFPDAVTARGAKHMRELAGEAARGNRAAVLFVVQRGDCEAMAPADEIDPAYGEALRLAARQGVQVLAYQARVTPRTLKLIRPLPVRL